MSASTPRPAHGAGSTWDTPEAVERIVQAYATADVVAIRQAQIDLLGPIEGATIVDVGSGPGIYARDLALRGARVTAVDSAPAMRAGAIAEAQAAGVQIEVADGEANALAFPDATFDAATLVQVIEYVPDAVGALREIARVLKPGGRLIFMDSLQLGDVEGFDGMLQSFPVNFHEPYYGSYIKEDLADIFADAGLEHVESRPVFLSKLVVCAKPG